VPPITCVSLAFDFTKLSILYTNEAGGSSEQDFGLRRHYI
jgi:hypothetical protein